MYNDLGMGQNLCLTYDWGKNHPALPAPITMVYGIYNYSYWGESKPTYILGASHCRDGSKPIMTYYRMTGGRTIQLYQLWRLKGHHILSVPLPTPGLVGIPLCEGSCALAGSVALVMILYGAVAVRRNLTNHLDENWDWEARYSENTCIHLDIHHKWRYSGHI